jgi:hypothetical protein
MMDKMIIILISAQLSLAAAWLSLATSQMLQCSANPNDGGTFFREVSIQEDFLIFFQD